MTVTWKEYSNFLMRLWGWAAGSVSFSDKSPDEIVNPSSHFSIDSLKRLLNKHPILVLVKTIFGRSDD